MVRFYFPQNIKGLESYYDSNALKNSLFMLAEDDTGRLLAVCQFGYQGEHCQIRSIKAIDPSTDIALLDGLFRSVMFHVAELDCQTVEIEELPESMNDYLLHLGFEKAEDKWMHQDFAKALFSGCSGCGGSHD